MEDTISLIPPHDPFGGAILRKPEGRISGASPMIDHQQRITAPSEEACDAVAGMFTEDRAVGVAARYAVYAVAAGALAYDARATCAYSAHTRASAIADPEYASGGYVGLCRPYHSRAVCDLGMTPNSAASRPVQATRNGTSGKIIPKIALWLALWVLPETPTPFVLSPSTPVPPLAAEFVPLIPGFAATFESPS